MSALSLDALNKLENKNYLPMKKKFRTMSGVDHILGCTLIEITIGKITRKVLVYILDSKFNQYDLVLGLDLIPVFKLSLDENLCLSQGNQALFPRPVLNVNWHNILNIEKFDDKVSHLDPKKQRVIKDLIQSNSLAFAQHASDVGNVKHYECKIELLSNKFVAKKPYRCTHEDQVEIERQVNELLKYNIITESRSPYAFPVTMQYKKVGLGPIKEKTRMCIDFRELNKIIVPESHPFPLIDEIITQSRGCTWYSALDINMAYWSIPIRVGDQSKTAFITQHGHYEWRFMPFGLKTAPATFQRILAGILKRRKLSHFCVNYLDDVLVFSHSFEEHIRHLELLILAIYEEGFRLSFRKCTFAVHVINYLGHIIGSNFVKPLHDNLAAINAFPVPQSRRNIRQFLGKINFYRKFIPNSTTLLEPFHNLLRKQVPFSWSPHCQHSFEVVKRLLTSEPILAIFDWARPTLIYTDASGVGVGAVLKQRQDDGSEKP